MAEKETNTDTEEFNPFKVNIPKENLESSIRTEAMLRVLMREVAEIKAKQGFFSWLKSPERIYKRMLDNSVNQARKIYDEMQKYL